MRLVVQPIRFTDDVAQMRTFLETIGLQVYVESASGTWVDLAAGAGRVALHSAAEATTGARPSETHLCFETDDVDALAQQLTSAGVPGVVVYDEAYNRSVSCIDPLGDTIVFNGVADDPYGYEHHRPEPDVRWRVTAVRFADPLGPYEAFLRAAGFDPVMAPNPYYVNFAGAEHAGQVGLHRADLASLPIPEGAGGVHLCFETSEPLDAVSARLIDAGYADARIKTEDFGAVLHVTDPDGLDVQIHQPPKA